MTATADIRLRYDDRLTPDRVWTPDALTIPLDGLRPTVQWCARIHRLDPLREAVQVIGAIHGTEARRQPADRSDYLAYLQARGKKATKALWEAQKAFLATTYQEVTEASQPLDPLVTVTPNGLALEVFSHDESTYARWQLHPSGYTLCDDLLTGSSPFAWTVALQTQIHQLRRLRPTTLRFVTSTAGQERTLHVPYRWLRAFGQVQAASLLPASVCELTALDLYNILFILRRRKAKKAPRALRYELVPNEPPRLIIEPWDHRLTATGAVYRGETPQVIRTWGRQRLNLLIPLLPWIQRVTVHLVGPGLPTFYIADCGDSTLTVAFSGWVDSGWAGIATFDQLTPPVTDEVQVRRVMTGLQMPSQSPPTLATLTAAVHEPPSVVRAVVLQELLRGTLVHDLATGTLQPRCLIQPPLDVSALRYRDEREAQAHRLLDADQVHITKVHDRHGIGVTLEGDVTDRLAHRLYRPTFTLDPEGRTTEATCTCAHFRRSGLRLGPCEHLIALRVRSLREQAAKEQARQSPEGRRLIHAETRTLLKRIGDQATVYRLSLDDRQVIARFGANAGSLRMQRLLFPHPDAAREEYFNRLEKLSRQGFLDMSQAAQAP